MSLEIVRPIGDTNSGRLCFLKLRPFKVVCLRREGAFYPSGVGSKERNHLGMVVVLGSLFEVSHGRFYGTLLVILSQRSLGSTGDKGERWLRITRRVP